MTSPSLTVWHNVQNLMISCLFFCLWYDNDVKKLDVIGSTSFVLSSRVVTMEKKTLCFVLGKTICEVYREGTKGPKLVG